MPKFVIKLFYKIWKKKSQERNKSSRQKNKALIKLELFYFISSTLSRLREVFSVVLLAWYKEVTCEKIKMKNSNEGFKGRSSSRKGVKKKSICEIKTQSNVLKHESADKKCVVWVSSSIFVINYGEISTRTFCDNNKKKHWRRWFCNWAKAFNNAWIVLLEFLNFSKKKGPELCSTSTRTSSSHLQFSLFCS